MTSHISSNAPPCIFDRGAVFHHLRRAKAAQNASLDLIDDTALQLQDRLNEIMTPFSSALDLSPFPFLETIQEHPFSVHTPPSYLDEENLSFPPQSFDLILSNLGLHWVNDVPGVLVQCRQILKPGGLFLASIIGGHSLFELRECLIEAETNLCGGTRPRTSPMIDLYTAGTLMRRAHFGLPVADVETVTLLYEDMFDLMHDLRNMALTNALAQRPRHGTRRAVFDKAATLYQERFCNSDGLIPATFDILYLHGWREEPQPKS